jgi:glucokinase
MTGAAGAALGIDIGGTAVKLGLLGNEGAVLGKSRFAFDRNLSFRAFVETVAVQVHALCEACGVSIATIGVASPGYAEPGSGILVDGTDNVPSLKGRSLAGALEERLGRPALTVNDGLAAANAELRFGLGGRISRFVLVTIGTGIGGGFVLDGQLQSGPGRLPPEIGALVLDPAGERNYSGLPGTFEHLASAGAFVRADSRLRSQETGAAPADAREVFARAEAGDPVSIAAVDETARWIGQALGQMINLTNLDACVIGGGVAAAGDTLLGPIRKHIRDFTWPYLMARAKVTIATAGNDGGWMGAADFARSQL